MNMHSSECTTSGFAYLEPVKMEKNPMNDLKTMSEEVENELLNHILPFWDALKDDRGGFYGLMDFDLKIEKDAVKGVILNNRILWFYSNVYLNTKEKNALANAQHAYLFLKQSCFDEQYGGVYWMMNYDGTPNDDMKHTYNQAFAIYGLSSYYAASGDKEALQLAYQLYHTIETKCTDVYGYQEAFDRCWQPIENEKLSEDGFNAKKSMNTLLHIIEAYTELYRVDPNRDVGNSLKKALRLCKNKVYDSKSHVLGVFFDEQMKSIADLYSYGHDIEATWLIDRACEVLTDDALTVEMGVMTAQIADKVLESAFENGALNNQRCRGTIDKTRVWWVQAESVIGFLNSYQKSGDERFLQASLEIWEYIKKYIIDRRNGSEWYWCVDSHGEPIREEPIVEPWKCPYHNSRMCMEVMKRNADFS